MASVALGYWPAAALLWGLYALHLFVGPAPWVLRGHDDMARWRERFAAATPVASVDEILGGLHEGRALQCTPLGVPFVNALFSHGWIGKSYVSAQRANALIMRRFMWIPLPFAYAYPLLGPARLEPREHAGARSVAMVYRYLPIVDHLRWSSSGELLGVMTIAGRELVYFSLTVEAGAAG